MCDTFNFLWDEGAHMFFGKTKQNWSMVFFWNDTVSQMSQLTRDHMWKCDK